MLAFRALPCSHDKRRFFLLFLVTALVGEITNITDHYYTVDVIIAFKIGFVPIPTKGLKIMRTDQLNADTVPLHPRYAAWSHYWIWMTSLCYPEQSIILQWIKEIDFEVIGVKVLRLRVSRFQHSLNYQLQAKSENMSSRSNGILTRDLLFTILHYQ